MHPRRLLGKRAVGMFELISGRARKFRLEKLGEVVDRAVGVGADHVLITGDLTTTSLPREFEEAEQALEPLCLEPSRVTMIPGNHDRYTAASVRTRAFERYFGAFAPSTTYPWLRHLGEETAVLGLDATRSHLTATGLITADQFERAQALIRDEASSINRLIIACHYPVVAPEQYRSELHKKRMINFEAIADWLASLPPHLYCCGHVHAAWAFRPGTIPRQVCLNAGAPLLRDPTGLRPPGFLEIDLEGPLVTVQHHACVNDQWTIIPLLKNLPLFGSLNSL